MENKKQNTNKKATVVFDGKKNTIIIDPNTRTIESFRDCEIEKLIFTPGDNYLEICNEVFQDKNISIIDIDRESSYIYIGIKAFQGNIIKKVKLKTTSSIHISRKSFANNRIESFIIEGNPKEIFIDDTALENNNIKKLVLKATNRVAIYDDGNALIGNPIKSITLDAPIINIFPRFFNDKLLKNLKVLYIPKNACSESGNLFSKKHFYDIEIYGIKLKFIKQ